MKKEDGKMGTLILARHHESEWNKLGKWTGVTDIGLTDYGRDMSVKMGELIRGIPIDHAYASLQIRTIQTLLCMQDGSKCMDIPLTRDAALNERDYGDYTGKNKWEMEKLLGPEKFKEIRRGWDYPLPHGESLKMVYERAVPYFLKEILPRLKEGENVLVVAHGNSLRTIIKYIERVSDEGIADIEMPFGSVIIYDLDGDGHLLHKEVRQIPSSVPA
ncbi:MAG: 2,3-diphosphoglycerate-dependent phosphoglycerate mutase [Candidatus Pacebacteria bacterium]|nr:2,3-diphosphoglycerate-dependent phosphoglycerate mutase [Candidatus Paceibacterota bacterium]